jgi:hypothetical protein
VPGRFDPETIALQKYDKLRGKVDQANAISNAAQNAQIMGVRGSWALLNTEVAEKGITGFAKYSTLAQGGLAAIGTRVMGVVGSLGRVGEVVALAVAGFMLLDSWLSKNSKQAEKFNTSIKTAEEAMSNVTRTISAASDINGFGTATINNTVAFSNALNEVTGSLSEVIKLSREVDKASGAWDNFWDGVFSFVGKDRASKLAKSVAGQIQSSLDLLKREGLAESYKTEIQKILQVDDLENVDKVSEAFKNLSKEQQNALVAIQNNSNRLLGNAGSALQSFKDKTDEALKAQKTLSNSFLDTSPSFKYGESLVAVSSSLNTLVAQGPKRVAQALEELSTNMEKAAMFGPEFVSEFGKISAEFGKQKTVIDGLNNALVIYQKQLSVANTAAGPISGGFVSTAGGAAVGSGKSSKSSITREQASIANSDVREIQRALNNAPRDAVDKSLKLVEAAAKSLFDRGMAFIGKAVREAQTTASITIGKALTSNLTGPQKLQAEAAFTQQELKARLADISISEQMMDTQNQLVNEMKLANALQAEANILQKNAGTTDEKLLEQNKEASKNVAKASLGTGGVGAAGMLNSDLLSDKEKADIKRDLGRQKALQQAALQPAKILAESQLDASQIGLRSELPISQAQQEEELKKITDKTNASLLARQDVMSSIASVTSAEIIKSKQDAELAEKAVQQNRELEAINIKIAQAETLYAEALARKDEGAKTAQEGQLKQLNFLEQLKQKTEEAQTADTSLTTTKNKQPLLAQELLDLDKRYETLRSTSDLENQTATARLDTQSQILTLESQAYNYSQAYVITAQTILDKEKALLDLNIAQKQAQDTLSQKREASEERIAVLKAEGAIKNKAAIDAETAELTRQQNLSNTASAGLTAQYVSKVALLDKTREINVEQARYNELVAQTESLGQSLAAVFGTVGTAIGAAVSSMVSLAKTQQDNDKRVLAAKEKLAEYEENDDSDAKKKAIKDLTKAEKLKTITEIDGMAQVAGNTKKVFKEKTLAYKAFAAVEKTLHVISMAMKVKEMIQDGIALASKIATNGAGMASDVIAAGISGVKAVVEAIQGPFPMNVIAGAATAAVVAGLLSSIGGKGPSVGGGFVPNAEQRQETQGTAMGYDASGAKVQVRRGVFGDTDAKSESIVNSLELIRETSVDGLSYDNKMVTLLTSIDSGINKTAKGLYSIQGLRTGSMFGTVEGSQGGGFLRGKTSRNITDSGLLIEGTFAQLASDTNAAVIDFFEQVTVSKKNWYGKTKTWVESQRSEINDATSEFFQDIFGNATKLFIEVGAKAGVDVSAINQILGGMNVGKNFTSLRGLKGEDFEKELSAVIGTILDDAALAIFTSFEGFANFGEGMLETVIRVVDTNTKINQQIKNIGIDSGGLSFAITETLAKLAGGLENFLDQTNFFRENFLTEAERLAPVQKAVTNEMARLGYSSVGTRDEFKQLVQGLDLTTEAGQKNYQALMNVAEGFIAVTEEATKQADERKQLDQELFALTATREQLRERELQGLFDGNRELQREIWLKEDQISAAKALQSSLKSVTGTIKSQITALKDYKTSLLSGANSTLTATQQYRLAKTEIEGLVTTISKTATTPAEIEARNIAIGKLSSVSDKFLNQSRTLFASGAQYTSDFSSIMSIINSVGSNLEAQLTDAEKQLSALETSNSYLQSIDSASKTTAQLLQTYLELGGQPLATASFATGSNFVPQDMVAQIHRGERIIPAADNLELMSSIGNRNRTNEVLVIEIKKLNQKIQSLEQTVAQGAAMNAQATDRNTAEIAQAVVDSSGKAIQANRLQAKAGIR